MAQVHGDTVACGCLCACIFYFVWHGAKVGSPFTYTKFYYFCVFSLFVPQCEVESTIAPARKKPRIKPFVKIESMRSLTSIASSQSNQARLQKPPDGSLHVECEGAQTTISHERQSCASMKSDGSTLKSIDLTEDTISEGADGQTDANLSNSIADQFLSASERVKRRKRRRTAPARYNNDTFL